MTLNFLALFFKANFFNSQADPNPQPRANPHPRFCNPQNPNLEEKFGQIRKGCKLNRGYKLNLPN